MKRPARRSFYIGENVTDDRTRSAEKEAPLGKQDPLGIVLQRTQDASAEVANAPPPALRIPRRPVVKGSVSRIIPPSVKNKVPGRRRPLPSRTLGRTASNEEEQRSEGSSIESEDIEVLIPDELEEYTDKIVFGKLSKQGFGSSLSLSKLAFYCVAVSYAASLQNFTLFNNLIHRRGFFFVIPFCFCMYSIAFPLTYFELALGQYTQTSILAIFDNIAPIGFGIGLSALFLVVISVVISNDLLALMVAVLVNSYEVFGIGILWDNCIGPLSREHCVSFERSCNDFDKIGRSPLNALTYPLPRAQHLGDTCVLSYVPSIRSRLAEYEKQQFTESLPLVHYGLSGFDDFHSLRIVVYPYMAFLGYIPLGFCLLALMLSHLRGLVPSLAYAYLFITSLLTITLLAFAVFMSPPSYPSTETFYRVDLSIDVWLEAALMSCVIMQLGYGGIIFLGSQNTFFNDIATDSMIIVTATTVVFTCQASLYALIRDSFFFESAHGDTPYFREVYDAQKDLSNKVYRAGARTISIFLGSLNIFGHLQNPVTIVMTLFGILAIMVTKLVRIELLFSTALDYVGFLPSRGVRTALLYLICLSATLLSFIFNCPDCYLLQISLETNVMTAAAAILILCELLVVCGAYGSRRLLANISTMAAGHRGELTYGQYFIQEAVLLLWSIVIPVVLVATIIRNFMSDEVNFDRGDVVALVVILSPIPVCAFYRCWTFYHYNLNWRRLFTPEPELWGPRLTYHRILAERDEKRLRV